MKQRWILRVMGCLQLALGVAYLVAPGDFLLAMGHSEIPPDIAYPLGMLAARFIAYGLGFWLISRNPQAHVLWIRLMALIQLIDLGVGVWYTALGTVQWQQSGVPMFNAIWIALVCGFGWRGEAAQRQGSAA